MFGKSACVALVAAISIWILSSAVGNTHAVMAAVQHHGHHQLKLGHQDHQVLNSATAATRAPTNLVMAAMQHHGHQHLKLGHQDHQVLHAVMAATRAPTSLVIQGRPATMAAKTAMWATTRMVARVATRSARSET